MKRLLGLVMVWALAAGGVTIGQEQTPPPAEQAKTDSVTNIATPDAEGVFPSIMHKGDIRDFLKFIAVAANKNIVPSASVRGQISVNLFNVTWKEVLDVVLKANGFAYEQQGQFIYVYTQKELAEKIAASRKVISRVFALNYITPADAVTLIQPLLSEKGQITSSPEEQTTSDKGEVWAGQNMIVVVDYPEYVEKVAKALKDLDKRPPQVLVEATILVARLNDDMELGINFNALGGVDFVSTGKDFGVPGASEGNEFTLKGTTTALDLSNGNLRIGVVKGNIGMFIDALESITDTVTLGNPKILTLNRQEGEVRVGNDEGYITTESTATSTTQTVQFLQTGTILRFTPYVMDDGYIRMKLHPENSTGEVKLKGDFALPQKSATQVTTNVLVKDGRTIVIGGLFREQTTLSHSQVPLAGNIPILGNLLRHTSDSSVKEEVIFLITPRIVREKVDYAMGEKMLLETKTIQIGAREGMLGLARDRLASAHYQRARELEAMGRPDAALWHANLSVHASPVFLDALKYRNDLRGKQVYYGQYSSMQTFMRKLIAMDEQAGAVRPYGN